MTTYLSNSHLSGLRPKRHMHATIHSRPDIISKLMRERQVSRFLVAPSGYGKTYIALEYAQMLFDFQNTCWLECRSPCFLRDLDTQNLAASLMERDANLRLVVFDDIPRLGNARSDALSAVIDKLLECSVEVIVTCKPACDAFSGRQIDRICLSPSELLLSNVEIEQYKETLNNNNKTYAQQNCFLEAENAPLPVYQQGCINDEQRCSANNSETYDTQSQRQGALWECRIPLLAWGGSDAHMQFALGFSKEEVPDVANAAIFVMLVLGCGNLSWVCDRCALPKPDATTLAYSFPHLGIHVSNNTFLTINLSLRHITEGFSARGEKIIAALSQDSTDGVACLLSELLLELKKPARACELAFSYATKTFRTQWINKNDRRLFQDLCILPTQLVAQSTKPLRGCDVYRIEVVLAWDYAMLGEVRSALKSATMVAASNSAPIRTRAWALVLLAEFATDKDVKQAVAKRVCMLSKSCEDTGNNRWQTDWYVATKCLSMSVLETNQLIAEIPYVVKQIAENAQFGDIAFFSLVSFLVKILDSDSFDFTPDVSDTLLGALEKFVWTPKASFSMFYLLAYQRICDLCNKRNTNVLLGGSNTLGSSENLGNSETPSPPNVFVKLPVHKSPELKSTTQKSPASKDKELKDKPPQDKKLQEKNPQATNPQKNLSSQITDSFSVIYALGLLLTDDVIEQLKHLQLRVEIQQQLYRIQKQTPKKTTKKPAITPKIPTSIQVSDEDKYPTLSVNIFGGFELLRDGVPLTSKYFGQAKVRALLALLVINGGREYSRQRLIEALWPFVNEKSGVKNLYSCWSSLVRGLSLTDGACPYVVRCQGSYKIEKNLVKSDVSLVNSLCKKLTIKDMDSRKYCEMLDELNTLYKGDLLPSESKNEAIMEERRLLRFQVSDTFSNAVARLIDMHEKKMALWFARVAYSHDNMREDVYYSLMSAQLACGQREAALETYSTCTRMLAKHFRMNPSDRMTMLYKSIVECEEVF